MIIVQGSRGDPPGAMLYLVETQPTYAPTQFHQPTPDDTTQITLPATQTTLPATHATINIVHSHVAAPDASPNAATKEARKEIQDARDTGNAGSAESGGIRGENVQHS